MLALFDIARMEEEAQRKEPTPARMAGTYASQDQIFPNAMYPAPWPHTVKATATEWWEGT